MTQSEFSGSASGKHRTVCFFFYRLYSSAEVYYKTHTFKLFGHQFKKHFLDQLKKTMLEIQRFYWSMINYFSKLRLTTTKKFQHLSSWYFQMDRKTSTLLNWKSISVGIKKLKVLPCIWRVNHAQSRRYHGLSMHKFGCKLYAAVLSVSENYRNKSRKSRI